MLFFDKVLVTFTISYILGFVLYFLFRYKTSVRYRKKNLSKFFSKYNIFFILVLLLIISILSVFSMIFLLYSIFRYDIYTFIRVSLSPFGIIFYCVLLMIIFAVGMYTTSIIVEDNAKSPKKIISISPTLSVIHGPITHIMIYQGIYLLFFIMAILETKFNFPIVYGSIQLYILLGGLFGVFFTINQVLNRTLLFQTPFLFLIFILHILFLIFFINNLILFYSFNIFLLSFGISSVIISMINFFIVKKNIIDSWY